MIKYLEKYQLGGIDQWILIRGEKLENPVLLFLHGGPGFAEMGFAPRFHRALEKNFLLVYWDQRGAGKSFSKRTPLESLTLEQFIQDAHQLAQILRERFQKERIYLMAHSWGSLFGTYLVQRYPRIFSAYIVCGYGIEYQENERLSYLHVFNRAKATNHQKAINELLKIPYPPSPEQFELYIKTKAKWMMKFGGYIHINAFKLLVCGITALLFSGAYTPLDIVKWLQGMRFSRVIASEILPKVDLFTQVPALDVPVYFCIGRHDCLTVAELTEKYYQQLKAPAKKFIWFENSAHCPQYEETAKFASVLVNTVLPETSG